MRQNLTPKNQIPEKPERVVRTKNSGPSSGIQKSVSSKVKTAMLGAGLLVGSANALACAPTNPSLEANIDVREIPELSEKGPTLSNDRYDEKKIHQALRSYFNELGEKNLDSAEFVDTSAFKTQNILKALPKETVLVNLAKNNPSYKLINYTKFIYSSSGEEGSNISFQDLKSDKSFTFRLYEGGGIYLIASTAFEKDQPVKSLFFDYENAQNKGYVQTMDVGANNSSFLSPDGFKITYQKNRNVWRESNSGKAISSGSLAELWESEALIGHNGLLDKYLTEAEKPSWAPKNLQEMLGIIKKLPSNSPEGFGQIIKKVVTYRKDPNNSDNYQFRHPDATLAEGLGDCDDFTILALVWAKANGFKARVTWLNGGDSGHVMTRLENPKSGEVFVVDNGEVELGEGAYQSRVKKYRDKFPDWRLEEQEYL